MNLTGTGVWSADMRYRDRGETRDAIAELDALGYSAIWIPDVGGDLVGALDHVLSASSQRLTVASGVLNVWKQDAAAVSAWWAALDGASKERLLLGIGISHVELIGQEWGSPLQVVRVYLDDLRVPDEHRCLAALRPKMLDLAASRTRGAHTYLVTPAHTADARARLGPDALLAPEQGVVLERDPARAREVARQAIAGYAGLRNYAGVWRDYGFTEEDLASVSDRLVDSLVAWGDLDTIAARVREHVDAGADHVCIQVLTPPGSPMPIDAWRELAPALV